MGNKYYRKKGDKIVIEEKIDGKTKYHKTLPSPEVLLDLLASRESVSKKTKSPVESIGKQTNKFVYELLTESPIKDAILDLKDMHILDEIYHNKMLPSTHIWRLVSIKAKQTRKRLDKLQKLRLIDSYKRRTEPLKRYALTQKGIIIYQELKDPVNNIYYMPTIEKMGKGLI